MSEENTVERDDDSSYNDDNNYDEYDDMNSVAAEESYESVNERESRANDESVEEHQNGPIQTYSLANMDFSNKRLGEGAFGILCLATLKRRDPKRDPKHVAVKCLSKRQLAKNHLLKQLALELAVHRSLEHRNILKFYGYQQDRDHVYFFLEYAAFGDLLGKLDR